MLYNKNWDVSIYRASLRVHGIRHGDPYFDFMSEVDNPIPDLTLRARYRSAVIEQARRVRP